MRRRRLVEPRRAIFVGTEAESERAFAGFLARCCDGAGLHVHLDIKPGTGGDSLSVVEEARRYLSRNAGRRQFEHTLVLLDRDRVDEDRAAGRDAPALAARSSLEIIYQDPNLEGLLFRLLPGNEQRRLAATRAGTELGRAWQEYRKPPTVDQLERRFELGDVQRAARYDHELRRLLDILGL